MAKRMRPYRNVLGVFLGDSGHDSSAALVQDGTIIAAAEEERFTRKKHDCQVPIHAINFCLRQGGIGMADVDALAIPNLPYRTGPDSYHALAQLSFLKRRNATGAIRYRSILHKHMLDAALCLGVRVNWGMEPALAAGLSKLKDVCGPLPPYRFFAHHQAHAAAAFFTSGLARAVVLTIDGVGGPYSAVSWRADNEGIFPLDAQPAENSLGIFFQACTEYLNLGEWAEGKTMGLASYGDRNAMPQVQSILDPDGGAWYRYHGLPTREILGFPPRGVEEIVASPYKDFAAAVQYALERSVQRSAKLAIECSGITDLCLGGGVALNCSANGALWNSGLASSVWVFPASGDGGLSLGAALLCARESRSDHPRMEHAYLGPEFTAPQCEEALRAKQADVSFERVLEVSREVAKLLADGQVVGWFQGRMEIGPRALGNRSILADPRSVSMRDRVNRIKSREMWRPLAPVVLAERSQEFFDLPGPSPFMLFAVQVKPAKHSEIPAVVHVDGTARPQTVTQEQNPALYRLVAAFSEITGVPVLLNTSFNQAGEPIVCSPEDAIRTFLSTGLDVLVLGNFVVRRRVA